MAAPNIVWMLADQLTGVRITDLPLVAGDVLKSVIGVETPQTFTMNVLDDGCPDNWQELLTPGNRLIVPVLDGNPLPALVLLDKTEGDPTVTLSCSSLENCLARTNVPDVAGTFDDATAAAMLVAPLTARFGFYVEYALTGRVSDYNYSNSEDRKILATLTEMRTGGGPEMRTLTRWHDSTHRAFDNVIQIGPQIGSTRPDAVFDVSYDTENRAHGSLESYTRVTSYAEGKGATYILGVSEGSASARTVTDPPVRANDLIAAGYPVWEERITYTGLGADTLDSNDLTVRANADLVGRRLGTVTYELTGSETCPRPGVDFDEGDTVTFKLAPHSRTVQTANGPRTVWIDRTGGSGLARLLGWSLDTKTGQVKPTIWDDPNT